MLKRLFDVTVAAIALLALTPVIGVTAFVVRRKLGSPVLFRQQRPGQNAKPFELTKFRSMLDAVDASGRNLPDHERLTPFGRALRKTSLDELPQLFNVLKGDMSLVGPRPLLMEYLPHYSKAQARRHEVRPGITGWAQVNGRNALSWDDKFKLDVWYVDNRTFWLDLKIMAMTLKKIARGTDVNASDTQTMPKFSGIPDETPSAASDTAS